MPTPPRDEKGRFIARPKPAPEYLGVSHFIASHQPVNSSASRPRPRASIVHDVVPEPRRRVWPRLVVVVAVAMAAVIAAIVWAVTQR